jgi:small subunit ribosomal protein S13
VKIISYLRNFYTLSDEESFQFIVRIGGTDVRGEYLTLHGLTKIKGVGPRMSRIILEKTGIPADIRMGFISEEDVTKIEDFLANPRSFDVPNYLLNRIKDPVMGEDRHVIGNDLATTLKNDIDRMKKTRSIKGIRHSLGLTVRGQRTRTSGRGKGKAVGVQRKKQS